MNLLFRDVEVDGNRVDVRVKGTYVVDVGANQRAGDEEPVTVVDGHRGVLLPGLHDHHVHLLALAAARDSVDCGPAVCDRSRLAADLREARGPWVRGTGYHESVAGHLDRHALDELVPDRPVRIQHRSGALWMLNSSALALVSHLLDDSADVERDARGEPTGRLWRYDARLRPALTPPDLDLARLGRELADHGITSVTDATPDLDAEAVALLAAAHAGGDLPQRITLLGAPTGTALPTGLTAGPRKLLLRDHALPTFDQLRGMIAETHRTGRAVAVHCVTSESLTLTLAVVEDVGTVPGDRIEHASVVPPGLAPWIADLEVAVVTQPDFLRTRGDDYLREVDIAEQPFLYPYRSLVTSGVRVAVSSDAPYGELDPWKVIRTAGQRTSMRGRVIGPEESVTTATALAGYLSFPSDPGGSIRQVRPGVRADLCLLHVPLADALRDPRSELVRLTVIGGRLHQ
ncbi:amidohydrolase family protein [Dactylosporangium fulvum]|uniref:Amidohydrolase family protein n=1 Tax=Dactylosporangium fulvum TaxID=53359 RepID=A0ABY5W8C1_9ACTN|nr:amidohydrolase family protein [Dactylosporangium fulvum]UWP85610.1 amidohydrolase family protein [Dactylosporangium fulvum]